MTGSVGVQRGVGSSGPRFDPSQVRSFQHLGWETSPGNGAVEVRLKYALDDGREGRTFVERFRFPVDGSVPADDARLASALDVLLVCAGTSYYKAAAPPVVGGVPGWLTGFTGQLYLHGLAEFALVNQLDPIRPRLEVADGAPAEAVARGGLSSAPVLVAVGGGKDSIVTIEMLRSAHRSLVLGSVRTHRAIDETARVAGVPHVVIDRELDPALLALNDHGALNGHVPVTAINSAALAVCAVLNGYSTVVMSNEWSASVPISEHRGLPVNHQWSKSLECERLLAGLLPVEYFSLLRPLHEVEICHRFARLRQYFDIVTSCNRAYSAAGRRAGTRWCGNCPKCRFVYLGLAPFLALADMDRIFEGARLLGGAFPDPSVLDAYRAILGLAGDPPLECVGTVRESRWAIRRLASTDVFDPVWGDSSAVRTLVAELDSSEAVQADHGAPDAAWDPLVERGEHAVPPEWFRLLSETTGGSGTTEQGHPGESHASR